MHVLWLWINSVIFICKGQHIRTCWFRASYACWINTQGPNHQLLNIFSKGEQKKWVIWCSLIKLTTQHFFKTLKSICLWKLNEYRFLMERPPSPKHTISPEWFWLVNYMLSSTSPCKWPQPWPWHSSISKNNNLFSMLDELSLWWFSAIILYYLWRKLVLYFQINDRWREKGNKRQRQNTV